MSKMNYINAMKVPANDENTLELLRTIGLFNDDIRIEFVAINVTYSLPRKGN